RHPLLRRMFGAVYPLKARSPAKRLVVDGLVTPEEAGFYLHEARGSSGEPLFAADEALLGPKAPELSAALPDWPQTPLNRAIQDRVRREIRQHFGERRRLHLVGGHLRRARGVPLGSEEDANGPSVCHVDKANISYYDYSAIVYFSTQGVDFGGGALAFNDPGGDQLVQPRLGRCAIFAAGPHHLHQAKVVTWGSRSIMALWFSLNCRLAGEAVRMNWPKKKKRARGRATG
ncbi:unnamed protein product, partial [Effrenium voratum]